MNNEENISKFPEAKLRDIEAFQKLDACNLKNIADNGQILDFKEGWPLSNEDEISSKIYFIIKGCARLLGIQENKLVTITKLMEGETIGLASILRGSPCEQVSASTKLKVFCLSDLQVIELYQKDKSFKTWCDSKIFPSEISSLIKILINNSSSQDINFLSIFLKFINSKDIKIVNSSYVPQNSENLYFGSKSHEENPIGNLVSKTININIQKESNIEHRFICISKTLIEEIHSNSNNLNTNTKTIKPNPHETNSNYSTSLPEKSSLINDSYFNQSKEKVILAKGKVPACLACLKMLTNRLDMPLRRDTIERILLQEYKKNKEISTQLMTGILSMMGLYTSVSKLPKELGTRLPSGSLIKWKDSYALVQNANSKGLTIASPEDGQVNIKLEELNNFFPDNIELLIVEKSSLTPKKKFGFNWFLPSIKKYQSGLLLVLLASFVVQLFGLANPLLIQVIIDKVISQRSLDTLQILGFALIFVTFLGGILGSLRTFLFTETTNRIDTRLASEVIDHLLRLPLRYFDNRPVGELGSRVGELEKIREFLTGQALTTVLDAIFSIIYIVVMVLYSWLLTFVALAVVPIQIGITLLGSPIIRSQIRNVANQNAKTQSHLVEVLTGIQTVKAQNIETVTRWKWQDLYSNYITKSFFRTITGTGLGQTSQVLQQLSQLLVLWIGASLVLKGNLSLGQLIAFRIISSYVTQPLLRLSTIWQSFQELKVSFERLADIIDTPEESSEKDKTNIALPNLIGEINFQEVSFSFNKGVKPILKNINLSVSPGEFVGIAGQSGSGKSTLMKLLPRLYELDSGKISIDNYDISKVELYSLRKQIGVVPQEPLLFSGSVSENISITSPDIGEEEIINAAKIANAHDFIMELSDGYSTEVGERGSRLSGGQKQRIAIARTLISKPKLLIMDEATSALDYQSERKVCENLRQNCKDVSVFFITHRLSTIKNADTIVMMADGSVIEIGTHEKLMDMRGSYYALYRQQEAQ